MIYTASYFHPKHHHGTLRPISRSIPPQYRRQIHPSEITRLLAPSSGLLATWKEREATSIQTGEWFPSEADIEWYTAQYRREVAVSLPEIKRYVFALTPDNDETWLCWEAPGEFCHRNLALLLVQKFRPDCCGGADLEVPPTKTRSPHLVYEPQPGDFQPGDRVRLKKAPQQIYEFRSYAPLTLTWGVNDSNADNPSCLLVGSDGQLATWFKKQLERIPYGNSNN